MKKKLWAVGFMIVIGIFSFYEIEKKLEVSAYGASSRGTDITAVYPSPKDSKSSRAQLISSENLGNKQLLGRKLGAGAECTHVNDMCRQASRLENKSQNPTKYKNDAYGDKGRNMTTSMNQQTTNPANRKEGGRPEKETRFKGLEDLALEYPQYPLNKLKLSNTTSGFVHSSMVQQAGFIQQNKYNKIKRSIYYGGKEENAQKTWHQRGLQQNALYDDSKKNAQDASHRADEHEKLTKPPILA